MLNRISAGRWGWERVVMVLVMCAAAMPVVAEWRAGASSGAINPAQGVWLAGYDLNRASSGVHDDLFAKALVVDDGASRIALVVIDSIGVQYDTVNAIRDAVAAKLPDFPKERVIVQSTHTHASPDVIGIYGKDQEHTGRDDAYMKLLVSTAADQVAAAVKRLTPVQWVWAETECKGWAVNDSEPAVLDNTVQILQARDAQGASVATLTNFPCHPTVLDGDNTLTSSDWVGAFYKMMTKEKPGEHFFLQGAIGCWMQPVTPERTFALAEKYGQDLAAKTLEAVEKAAPLKGDSLQFARNVFEMPLGKDCQYRQFGVAGLVPRQFGDTVTTEVAWFAIGDAQFATLPGEAAPVFAKKTREMMKTGPRFVLGLGLDQLGYICPETFFDAPDSAKFADYLISMSPGREAGQTMLSALSGIIK